MGNSSDRPNVGPGVHVEPKRAKMEMLVQIEEHGGRTVAFKFETSFRIGRDSRCELTLESPYVSRIHAHITLENDRWWITDLASSNGTFCGSDRVDRKQIEAGQRYYLSKRGPRLTFYDLESRPSKWRSPLTNQSSGPQISDDDPVTKTSILPVDGPEDQPGLDSV